MSVFFVFTFLRNMCKPCQYNLEHLGGDYSHANRD